MTSHSERLLLAVLLLAAAPALATPITSLDTAYGECTGTDQSYTASGVGSFDSGKTYEMNFEQGSGTDDNLLVNGFSTSSASFWNVSQAGTFGLRRNTSGTSNTLVWYEEVDITDTDNDGNEDLYLRPSRVTSMEQALNCRTITRGTDNVFGNTGDGSGNNNNIERIDYLFTNGITATSSAVLNGSGFLVLERGGNDDFQIAAVTSLDSNTTEPDAYNTPVSYDNADGVWGDSTIDVDSIVFRAQNTTDDLNPSADIGAQDMDGIFVSLADLGMSVNDTIYGYSLFASDVTYDKTADLVNWKDSTHYPTTTSSSSNANGLDLIAGGTYWTSVPEPASVLLFGLGLTGLAGVGGRRKRHKSE